MQSYREIVFSVGRAVEAKAISKEGVGRKTKVSYRKVQIPKGKVVCACFFFLNIFAYIYHFIVCIYRRPYRKLIFVIVDLLILFT